MRNTRGAQQGVHPTSLCAALIPSPACLLSRAGLRQSSTPFPLSVLLCCTACKAQPVLHTGHVPAAPTDKGSNPGSIEVQWCQKTQETALNSQILSTERFPAALHPPGATHQTLQFIAQHHLPQETAAGSDITAVPLSSLRRQSPRCHQQCHPSSHWSLWMPRLSHS